MTLEEIRARLAELQTSIRSLAEIPELDDEQRTQWDADTSEFDTLTERAADIEARQARAAAAAAVDFNVIVKPEPAAVLEDRTSTPTQLADALTRSVEGQVNADNMGHVRQVVRRHATDTRWARNMLARSTDLYARAWAKVMTGGRDFLTEEERAAMAVGTNTAGGFLVPTHLDPTLILTNEGSQNAIRAISRVVTLTEGNAWNGVTSAGVTASWDGELVEVSDDTPAVARVSVPLYKAQAFVQASTESIADIAGLASDVLMMFADARDRLEGAAHATGSGSSQPTGIFTALDANTNVELTSTTAATIGLVDLHATKNAVGPRWRGRGTWVMNPTYAATVQQLGTAVGASYSTDITQAITPTLLGRPLVETDDAPNTQTTTVRDNEIVYGDFSNFLVVDKPGSFSVDYIPHLFATANNLPDGRSGWYAYWRTGSDSVNDVAFTLLQDKTSA